MEQVKQLQAQNKKLVKEQLRSEATIEWFMERVEKLQWSSGPANPTWSSPAMPLGARLPSHNRMGGHALLPLASDSTTHPMATPEGSAKPPVQTAFGGRTPGLNAATTPTPTELTPQRSASLAAPPPQKQEEDMDSEPKAGLESQQ